MMRGDERDRPLPPDWTVEQAREGYMRENGFTLEAYDAARTEGSFLGFRFTVPNSPRHRWAIMLHDLHHVATGFGTDPTGEGEMAAWELRRGLRPLGFYTGSIVVTAVLLGVVVAPRRTIRAWRASGSGDSLFHMSETGYEALLRLRLCELRRTLGVPAEGLATERRGLHSLAPRSC